MEASSNRDTESRGGIVFRGLRSARIASWSHLAHTTPRAIRSLTDTENSKTSIAIPRRLHGHFDPKDGITTDRLWRTDIDEVADPHAGYTWVIE